jgi:hypothetical protein
MAYLENKPKRWGEVPMVGFNVVRKLLSCNGAEGREM